MLNSVEFENPTPVTTLLASVGPIYRPPQIVGNKLVFLPFTATEYVGETQVWITDGTIAGTHTVGSPFIGYSYTESITEALVVGSDVYMLYRPVFDYELANEGTLAAQIWMFNTISGSLSSVADFYGRDFVFNPPHNLVAAGDRIFFIAWDTSRNHEVLWAYRPGSSASIVEPKSSNGYFRPQQLVFAGGSLYFAAQSEAVIDLNGNATSQPWVIDLSAIPEPDLPGDFNNDGSVDAADYVLWRKLGLSAEQYTVWRQNFGALSSTAARAAKMLAAAAQEMAAAKPRQRTHCRRTCSPKQRLRNQCMPCKSIPSLMRRSKVRRVH